MPKLSQLPAATVLTGSEYLPVVQSGATKVCSVSDIKTFVGVPTVTKEDVGLGNADNTADATKNVLSATKLTTARNINGIAFDGTSDITIPVGSAPSITDISITHNASTVVVVSSDGIDGVINAATTTLAGAMSASDKTKLDGIAAGANNYTHPTGDGNLHVPATGTTNSGKVLTAGATAGSLSWTAIPAAPVSSVAGKTGAVTLVKGDVGLGNVDNTSDLNKPISAATQLALDGKAESAHTHTVSQITDFESAVNSKIQAVVGSAPEALDTLAEIAAQLGNDQDAVAALTATVAGKADAVHTHAISDVNGLQTALDGKLDTLVSGTNIKTINGTSVLGSGDLVVAGGSSFTVTEETLTADRTLTEADAGTWLFATTGNRVIFLPVTPTNDIEFNIVYVGTTLNIYVEIRCTGDTNYFTRLFSGAAAKIAFDVATGKWTLYGNGYRVTRTGANAYSLDTATSIGYLANGSINGAAIGYAANGSSYGVAVGRVANGSSSGVAVGYVAVATKQYGSAIGYLSKQERYGGHARSGDHLSTSKLHVEEVHWAGVTTTATETELFLHGVSANRCVLLASSVLGFTVRVTGIASTTFNVIDLELKGTIKRDASNVTTLVGAVTTTVINNELSGATAVLTADDTNEALKLTVTGLASTTINWGAVGLLLDRRI